MTFPWSSYFPPLAVQAGLTCMGAHLALAPLLAFVLPAGPWTQLPNPTAHQVVCLPLMLLTLFVIPAILGCLHGTWIGYVRANQTYLEETPISTATSIEQTLARAYPTRHGYAPKNSQRLLPNTSLQRVREPHAKLYKNYNKEWESVPSPQVRTFYYDGKKQAHPFIRALIQKGWRQVDQFDEAHLLYSHQQKANWANSLEPWQRFNYIPNKDLWGM